ncbi:DUF2294 domain-containing protein [Robertmurraya kyonggiensis]|uniref:DUF2294 domain-containing protein n=1 Tax=Robertmurraya kyonggiensis TaxID=1037680 RepID=A0A4U1CZP7_9BACI|nr:DUF2294 domain-containing protein [Robertmurraya kyonggiensis]TKC14938.1 DUF2294 domain-containing protein [Robertmurraya kyonggiensis]
MTKNLEHHFSMLIREIRKEHIGNGPREINTRIVGPWVICEMKGNLSNVEKFMIKSNEGQLMVHEARTELVKNIYKEPTVVNKLEELVEAKFVSLFTDINIDLDTAMTVFVFDKSIKENSDMKN